jgi:hypothetical protein
MASQMINNNIIEDLVECSVADIQRMIKTIFNELKEELKEDIQKHLNESEEAHG